MKCDYDRTTYRKYVMHLRAKDLDHLEKQEELRLIAWTNIAPYLKEKQTIQQFWSLPTDEDYVPVSKRKTQLDLLMELREQTIAYYKTLPENGG